MRGQYYAWRYALSSYFALQSKNIDTLVSRTIIRAMKHGFKHYPEQFYLGICHRGLHDDTRSENGMKAFENAIENNMAFEFDIHLSKDGILFVSHDSDLKRMTGKDGIIEELTSSEIKANYRLPDGGEIPTLEEVLNLNNEKVLTVIELKVYNDNYKELAKKTKEALKGIKDKSKVAIISFDPRALFHMGHRFERQLLLFRGKEWVKRFRFMFESIDIEMDMAKDDWVKSYRKHGGIVNCWTIETKEQVEELSPYVDAMTFQYVDKDVVIKDRKNYLKNRKR